MKKMHTLLQALADHHLTLGAVESLSGGRFADEACFYPGASAVFKGSLVTYTPDVKIACAGVKKEIIEKYGIVSPQVAAEMARGGKKALGVDVCLSCTGNAGPTVQEGGAEVGDVCIGMSYKGSTWVISVKFGQRERDQIRTLTVSSMVDFAMSLFRKALTPEKVVED